MAGKGPYPEVPEAALAGVVRTNLDSPTPTPAQLDRRAKNIALVRAMGLPVMEQLPVVEDESSVTPRTSEEVAARCLATAFCAVKGESNDAALVDSLVAEFGVAGALSPEEQAFVAARHGSPADLAKFGWRYECVHVFLWALGYLDALLPPNEIAEVAREMRIVRQKGPRGFARDARLRPLSELLDANDLYYRLDWAAVDLRLKGTPSAEADEEIVVERHRALNWLIRYQHQEWDDVTTDT